LPSASTSPKSIDVPTYRRLTGRLIFSRYKKCETAGSPESKSKGNSLFAKAGVSTPPANTVETTGRDQYYAFLLANMQNNSGPKPAVKIPANLAEPSVDAIYNACPNQGPGFYRYVERNSGRLTYYLGRPRRIAN
jgi:hypothetical protein